MYFLSDNKSSADWKVKELGLIPLFEVSEKKTFIFSIKHQLCLDYIKQDSISLAIHCIYIIIITILFFEVVMKAPTPQNQKITTSSVKVTTH